MKRNVYRVNPTLEEIGQEIFEVKVGKEDKLEDKRQFLKVYFKNNVFSEFAELTQSAQRILAYIIETHLIKKNDIEVVVKPALIVDNLRLHPSGVSRGLAELIETKWLFHSNVTNGYWLNLNRMCYGSSEEVYERFRQTVLK